MNNKQVFSLFISILTAAFLGLGGFWIGSIASDGDLRGVRQKQDAFKSEVERYYSRKSEVRALDSKVDSILTGLCIIDKRTCPLKDKKGN